MKRRQGKEEVKGGRKWKGRSEERGKERIFRTPF